MSNQSLEPIRVGRPPLAAQLQLWPAHELPAAFAIASLEWAAIRCLSTVAAIAGVASGRLKRKWAMHYLLRRCVKRLRWDCGPIGLIQKHAMRSDVLANLPLQPTCASSAGCSAEFKR